MEWLVKKWAKIELGDENGVSVMRVFQLNFSHMQMALYIVFAIYEDIFDLNCTQFATFQKKIIFFCLVRALNLLEISWSLQQCLKTKKQGIHTIAFLVTVFFY